MCNAYAASPIWIPPNSTQVIAIAVAEVYSNPARASRSTSGASTGSTIPKQRQVRNADPAHVRAGAPGAGDRAAADRMPVLPARLHHPVAPAVALRPQLAQRRGPFGPGPGLTLVGNSPAGDAQGDRQAGVFCQGVGRDASYAVDRGVLEADGVLDVLPAAEPVAGCRPWCCLRPLRRRSRTAARRASGSCRAQRRYRRRRGRQSRRGMQPCRRSELREVLEVNIRGTVDAVLDESGDRVGTRVGACPRPAPLIHMLHHFAEACRRIEPDCSSSGPCYRHPPTNDSSATL